MYATGLTTVPTLFQVFPRQMSADGRGRVHDKTQSRAKLADLWESFFFPPCCCHTFVVPISDHFLTPDQNVIPSKKKMFAGRLWQARCAQQCSLAHFFFFVRDKCVNTLGCHQAVVASCAEVFISQWDKPPRCTPTLVLQDGVPFSLHSLAFSVAGKRYVED